jgi:hypothetical protein
MELREIVCDGVNWMELPQDRVQLRVLALVVLSILVAQLVRFCF